jgi:hypothetical protein
MATNGNPGELTPRQRRAITTLLGSKNVQEAAALSNVGERTLYRWMTEPAFKAALLAAEGEAIDAATRRLISLIEPAAEELENILTGFGGNVNAQTRLRAVDIIFSQMARLRELRNVEERLTALEAAISAKH